MTHEEIVRRVSKCLAEVLTLEAASINPHSRIIDELKADSLDLVELMYLLEQEFSITLSRNDLSISAQLGLPASETHQQEVLTPRALELLRERYPRAADRLTPGIQRKHLALLLTVEEVACSVERRLAATAR
jgi:acyl carrier protein